MQMPHSKRLWGVDPLQSEAIKLHNQASVTHASRVQHACDRLKTKKRERLAEIGAVTCNYSSRRAGALIMPQVTEENIPPA
eukprot:6096180-Prymnesium_polylepis.1